MYVHMDVLVNVNDVAKYKASNEIGSLPLYDHDDALGRSFF